MKPLIPAISGDALYIPGSHGHYCQVHQEEFALVQAVVKFLAAGVPNGESIVLVTRKKRQEQILDWLNAKLPASARLEEEKNLFLRSSTELLDALMVDGVPQWEAFEPLAATLLNLASDNGCRDVRIYGDAVSELWQSGQHETAIMLERFWNRFLGRYSGVKSFCGYLIDALAPTSYSVHLQKLGYEHSMMAAGKDQLNLLSSLDQASREILGVVVSTEATRELADDDWRARIPLPMRSVWWLMENEAQAVDNVLQRARFLLSAL